MIWIRFLKCLALYEYKYRASTKQVFSLCRLEFSGAFGNNYGDRKELTLKNHSSILTLKKKGYSSRQISAIVNISQPVAPCTIKNFMDSDTWSSKQRTRRQRRNTEGEESYILTICKRNRRMTAPEITHKLNQISVRGNAIGVKAAKRWLLGSTLRDCAATKRNDFIWRTYERTI